MPGHYGMMEAKGKEKMARKAKGKKSASKKMAMKKAAMKKIREAVKASEILGKAYDSSKMAPAKHITKESAAVLNQLGA